MKKNYHYIQYFKCLLLAVALYLAPCVVLAQMTHSLKGLVIDSTSANKFENGRVLLLNAKDSILVNYTKIKRDGSFVISNASHGSYILLITYPGYADYADHFVINEDTKVYDFGKIYLTNTVKLLKEVVIRGRSRIRIKGDTTEFNAEHFVIQPNSKVEDLLKQFPGIEVDKEGRIRAGGQTVSRVLVDGEEFFGDDPTLVTRNIRGDMVDKIQLFDKKSDQATLTGIDDGKKTKAINVVLKEDSKNGYFGNINAGLNFKKPYEAQAMFNKFEAKQKMAFYGNIATTGKTGPDFSQGSKFGTAPTSITSIGGVSGFFDELEGTGRYDGHGLPFSKTSGAHYDRKWSDDKKSINGNYRIGSIETEGSENTTAQQIFLTDITNVQTRKSFTKYVFRQKGDAVYQTDLGKESNLKVMFDATTKNFDNKSNTQSSRFFDNGGSITKQYMDLSSNGDQRNLNLNVSWTKKFKKRGRSIIINVGPSFGQRNINSIQNSSNDFYNRTGGLDSVANIDRSEVKRNKDFNLNTSVGYSEPLTKKTALYFTYTLNLTKSKFDRETRDKASSGIYDLIDPTLNNHLDFDQVSNQYGTILNYRTQKSNTNVALNLNSIAFRQLDLTTAEHFDRNYLNWNTRLDYSYNFSPQKRLRFYYTGNNAQPSISQLQPIKIVDDPLNITIGNLYLKPSYTSRFNTTFSSYKPLTNQNLSLSASYSLTTDPFSFSFNTEASGKTTVQTINISGRSNSEASLNADISRKIKGLDLQVSLNTGTNLNTNYDIINSILNKRSYISYNAGIRISKDKLNAYNFSARFNTTINHSRQSARALLDNNIIYNGGTDMTLFLPFHFESALDMSYTYTSNRGIFGSAINPLIINSSIGRKFLKNESLKIAAAVNNLLNQNPGYIRSPNYESIYTTIRRYVLLSVVWDFTKMGNLNQ